MLRTIMLICICGFASTCLSNDNIEILPQPHYHQLPSDPTWMKYAVQLHGHLGPMLSFGARMGAAALRAVDAKGYFDVEVTCEGPFENPPASCFLDGMQIATGATLGKRNLHWTKSDKIVIRIKNTRTGKMAEVHPKDQFLALLPQPGDDPKSGSGGNRQPKGDDDHLFDPLARKIAVMPEKEILVVTYPNAK
jgi:formylmethanofuran dehydrogenase subunit E